MDYWKGLLKKYYPKIEFGGFTGYGLAGHLAIPEALNKLGRNVTRERMIQVFDTFTNWTTDNWPMAYPISWSPTDHIGMKRDAMSTMATGKINVIYKWKEYEEIMKGK
jgi:maltoporin